MEDKEIKDYKFNLAKAKLNALELLKKYMSEENYRDIKIEIAKEASDNVKYEVETLHYWNQYQEPDCDIEELNEEEWSKLIDEETDYGYYKSFYINDILIDERVNLG